MPRAILIDEFGGPGVMQWREVPSPEPGDGEVLIRHTAIGLNYIDTYHRSGLYPLELPASIGTEAAGVVERAGPGVREFAAGDRVAYVGLPPGSYCELRAWPADKLVRLPGGVDEETAAAAMLKGLTAWYLLRRSYPVQPGDPVLLYAAAGGVGLIAAQWAAHLGARVIGVTGNEEKAALARAHGCAEVVLAGTPGFVERVRELSGGGVAAVYDSVGRDTFMQSLDCLRPHGTMVTFGNASGPPDPIAPMELARRGSLKLTRPSLFDFITDRADLLGGSAELFTLIGAGTVRIGINQRRPLAEAADAHRDLEARRTTGSTVLVP